MKILKTTPAKHKAAIDKLKERRKNEPWQEDNRKLDNAIRDYTTHMNKCGFGKTIIDIGCGRQYLKECLPKNIEYIGIDCFPAEGYELKTTDLKVEDDFFADTFEADTIVAFAVLDNCLDFDKAITNMKKVATKNIIILTGIGIPVDQYHTLRLELEDFDQKFIGWKNTVREMVSPKVWLLNFEKP
ncbi:MAG: hypothetical protein ACRCYO_13540 [Bacteroidia bacterium]